MRNFSQASVCLYTLCQGWDEETQLPPDSPHNHIVPMINRYNWKHFVLFCKCKCEKEIVNDVNSWPAIIVMITAHLHSQPVRPGFVWNYCSMSSVSSPLSFFRVCFHVLLIIRFSAGLYWITPEAHHWLNDVGSETHKFDKVPSFANRRNVMNIIEIIRGTAPWMADGIELKFPFWAVFWRRKPSLTTLSITNHCWLPARCQ